MATSLQSLRIPARICRCSRSTHRFAARSIDRRRLFSSTCPKLFEPIDEYDAKILAKLKDASSGEALSKLELQLPNSSSFEREIETAFNSINRDNGPHTRLPFPSKKVKPTFNNLGEDEVIEEDGLEEDDTDHDDLTPLAHGELEQHREIRHYARLAAWELPLLAKLAKPFEVPTADMPLRFRYTTYMGEQHPAERKVVVEFCAADMPNLTEVQRMKLRKLTGVRYNPETDIVRMSCESYESQAQNKRYLGDLVNSLLKEARDPTDTFEDVPLDTRHHTFKIKPKFPKEWRLTEERQAELAEYRKRGLQSDQQRLITGQLVDGVKQIETALAQAPAAKAKELQLVAAGKGVKAKGAAKGKKVAVRR